LFHNARRGVMRPTAYPSLTEVVSLSPLILFNVHSPRSSRFVFVVISAPSDVQQLHGCSYWINGLIYSASANCGRMDSPVRMIYWSVIDLL